MTMKGSSGAEPAYRWVIVAPSAVMLAISDALALTLMELKNFTAADYHARHHRGYLGSKSRQPHLYDSEPDANS